MQASIVFKITLHYSTAVLGRDMVGQITLLAPFPILPSLPPPDGSRVDSILQ